MSACPPCEICSHHHFPADPCWECHSDHACRRGRPDAAPPKEVVQPCLGCDGERWIPCGNCNPDGGADPPCVAPPSDAAPVAVRCRRTDVPDKWLYWHPGDPEHHDPRNYTKGRDDFEVQRLILHSEDATLHSGAAIKADLRSEEAPSRPWVEWAREKWAELFASKREAE